MKHTVSRDLHAYWDRLRAGRTAPERGDVDPAAIRHILAYTFVLDVNGSRSSCAHDARFRLSGTRVNALFGHDLKGWSFDRLWSRRNNPMAEAMIDGVLEDRCAVVASACGGPPGRAPIDLELMLLPLRHHGSTHARILGSLAATEVPGWMGLSAAAPLDLVSFRVLCDASEAARAAGIGTTDADRAGEFLRSVKTRHCPRPLGRIAAGSEPGPESPCRGEGRRRSIALPSAPTGTAPQAGPADPPLPQRMGRFTVYQGGRSEPGEVDVGR